MVFYNFSSKVAFFPILLTLFLFYHGYLITFLVPGLSLEVRYLLPFIFYFLAIFYRKQNFFSMNYWLLYAIFFIVLSFLVGLSMNWYLRDNLADVARFLGPFIGYTAGLAVLSRMSYIQLLSLVFYLSFIKIVTYYHSVIVKIIDTLQGRPIFDYAKAPLAVQFLFFFLFIYFIKTKAVNRTGRIILFGYLVGFVVNPFLEMSKARTITLLLCGIIVFVYIAKAKLKTALITVTLIALSLTYVSGAGEQIFQRYNNLFKLIQTGEYHDDASSSVRVTEIKNVTATLYNTFPYSLPFGMGAGAILYEVAAKIEGGINKENFRPDGGVHHIFTVYFAYLFRYGFIGLFLIMIWIYTIFRELARSHVYDPLYPLINPIRLSVMFFIVASMVADIFVPVHVYGNFQFGFFMAMGIVAVRKAKSTKLSIKKSNLLFKTAADSG
jgi:hypothetical protein